jgi:hypothetical protein
MLAKYGIFQSPHRNDNKKTTYEIYPLEFQTQFEIYLGKILILKNNFKKP